MAGVAVLQITHIPFCLIEGITSHFPFHGALGKAFTVSKIHVGFWGFFSPLSSAPEGREGTM